MSWLVVGLGNPGPRYARNRHNIGFMVVDLLAEIMGIDAAGFQHKFQAAYARGRLGPEDLQLLKPLTFMNRSGASVGAAAAFFKQPPDHVIVIHDELDLPFDQLRVKVGGGHAGHNGLRSIFEHYGREFVRVRCGIGRPAQGAISDFVLSDFTAAEGAALPEFIAEAARAVELITARGARDAMNSIHPAQRAKATAST